MKVKFKTEYKPIAMRCTQEQFLSIKDSITLPIKYIECFIDNPYLVNNLDGNICVSNVVESRKSGFDREVIQTFDGEYFLDCCGREKEIFVDNSYTDNIIGSLNTLNFVSGSNSVVVPKVEYQSNNSKQTRSEHFDKVINETLEEIKNLLVVKGKEYRRNDNPYHNFERGAEITNLSREEVLQGFLLKHIISLEDIRNDLKKGKIPSYDKVQEKYNDCLTYILIEKAMILEQIKNK